MATSDLFLCVPAQSPNGNGFNYSKSECAAKDANNYLDMTSVDDSSTDMMLSTSTNSVGFCVFSYLKLHIYPFCLLYYSLNQRRNLHHRDQNRCALLLCMMQWQAPTILIARNSRIMPMLRKRISWPAMLWLWRKKKHWREVTIDVDVAVCRKSIMSVNMLMLLVRMSVLR